jgi:DNA-binding CsgD family transcriptional regulator
MPATNKIDRERVEQLLAKGLTQTQIAMRLGCTKSGLSTAIKGIRKEAVA